MGARTYRILDVDVRVASRPEAFLETFQANYFRFATEAPGPDLLDFRFEEGAEGTFMETDGIRVDLGDHPHARDHAAMHLAQRVLDRVRGYTVLHAGVVGTAEGALAIAGPSGAGKTTLTLGLLEAGCTYFSDDFCPIARDTGRVHPFPRSLWVRAPEGARASSRGKAILPLDEARVARDPLPLAGLVCLQGPEGLDQVGVALRRGREDAFLAAARTLDGAEVQAPGPEWPELWLIRYPRARTAALKALLDRHRDACWNAFSLAGVRPDFTGTPRLVRIPPAEAAFFLLRELRQDLLAPEAPGALKPGALLAHLGGLLADVPCYRLSPGPLAHEVALVRHALAGGTPG